MPRIAELARLDRAWSRDVEAARSELDASPAQAFVLAVHALAWRLSVVTFPVALVVSSWFFFLDEIGPGVVLLAAGLGAFGLQAVAFLATYPVEFLATLQTWYRGSREARLRFGVSNVVYPYYGWRFAFRNRSKPWGALTHEERVKLNPKRAGVTPTPPPSRNYWPE